MKGLMCGYMRSLYDTYVYSKGREVGNHIREKKGPELHGIVDERTMFKTYSHGRLDEGTKFKVTSKGWDTATPERVWKLRKIAETDEDKITCD